MKRIALFIRRENGSAAAEVLVLMSALVFLALTIASQLDGAVLEVADGIGTRANAVMADEAEATPIIPE